MEMKDHPVSSKSVDAFQTILFLKIYQMRCIFILFVHVEEEQHCFRSEICLMWKFVKKQVVKDYFKFNYNTSNYRSISTMAALVLKLTEELGTWLLWLAVLFLACYLGRFICSQRSYKCIKKTF
jgi:hypothetical protein